MNYGLLGNNLPRPEKVITLLKSRNITRVRIFDPNPAVLKALAGSNIELVLGVLNQDLEPLAVDQAFASRWVNTNVIPHVQAVKFRYVCAGNEVIPGPQAKYVLGAMQNLNAALKAAYINIPVSTAIHSATLANSFPPSSGAFSDEATSSLASIAAFLAANQSPLLANVYPYFAYAGDPVNMRLEYALGIRPDVVVTDGYFQYNNLVDAMVDTIYAALEKVGVQNVSIVVTESGWPSAGNGAIATIANARTYVNNLIAQVSSGKGTPKRPGKTIETYMFAIFNENQKPVGTEQNWGLYYPNMTEVYHVKLA